MSARCGPDEVNGLDGSGERHHRAPQGTASRVLRQLRESRLISFHNGEVTLHDLAGFRQLADFNDGYLYLEPDEL